MKGSLSLEALLTFVAVVVFWVTVFSAVSPHLQGLKHGVLEAQLRGECEKLANFIDTMSTYGEGITLDYTPFTGEELYFCQRSSDFCTTREITVIRIFGLNRTEVSCRTRIAEWVNIKSGGKILNCKEAVEKNIHTVNITYATYNEKENMPRACE